MEYSFNLFNQFAASGLLTALSRVVPQGRETVFVCIGSDLVIGDSVGPLVGSMIKRAHPDAFVYGTLEKTVTAKEVVYLNQFLADVHPDAFSVAIDAAVGDKGDIGLIKFSEKGLKPGLGANKSFPATGDASIMAIAAEKSMMNYSLMNLTRLNLVYKMSTVIAEAVNQYLDLSATKILNLA